MHRLKSKSNDKSNRRSFDFAQDDSLFWGKRTQNAKGGDRGPLPLHDSDLD